MFTALSATAIVNELSYKNKIVTLTENKNAYTITETETEQLNLLSIIGRLIKCWTNPGGEREGAENQEWITLGEWYSRPQWRNETNSHLPENMPNLKY